MNDCLRPPEQNPILPLARYRFRFEIAGGTESREWLLKKYLGSAWRGVFGAALRNTVCVTRQPTCDGCALLSSCPYPQIFENRPPAGAEKMTRYPRTPGPYVLEPANPEFDTTQQDFLNLGLVLFGSANQQLPYIVHALEQAGQRGLSSRKIRLNLNDVQFEPEPPQDDSGNGNHSETESAIGWKEIYRPGEELSPPSPWAPKVPDLPGHVRVHLLSPLRLRRENRVLGVEAVDFSAFMSSLIRRISMLTYFFSSTPLETDFAGLARLARQAVIGKRDLKWRELKRFSQRQRKEISMGGLVGQFELEMDKVQLFWPYLWLGQWTHLGRTCSMGLGRYVLEYDGDLLNGGLSQLRPSRL